MKTFHKIIFTAAFDTLILKNQNLNEKLFWKYEKTGSDFILKLCLKIALLCFYL